MYVPGDSLQPGYSTTLESPSYDFKNNPGAGFSFKWAYAKKTLSNKDLFSVQASKDCGGTWLDVWSPNTTIMSNTSGGITSSAFIPTSSQWIKKNLLENSQFTPFTNENHVLIRFKFKADDFSNSNRFYLDEVNFEEPVGINELSRSVNFNVHPNPASSFVAEFNLSDETTIKYRLISITGEIIIESMEQLFKPGTHELTFNENKQLAAGLYFIHLNLNGATVSKKIIVQ